MSLHGEVQLKCLNCSGLIPFTVWQSINVTLDPEQKKRILDNSMFVVICPSCRKEYFFPYDFLYHDMEKQFILFYNEDDNTENADLERTVLPDEMLEFGTINEYKYRVVKGLNRLKEKILIFDENLDDFEIEHIKYALIQTIFEEEKRDKVQMYFHSKEENEYSFYIIDEEGNGYKKSISFTECQTAKKDIFVQFNTFQEGVDIINIDYQWIKNHLEPLPKEEVLSKLHRNYDYVGHRPYCGRIEVRQNNLSGFVDVSGNEVIPIIYKSVLPFVKEMSIVSLSKGKYGLIDINGKEIIPCKYDNVTTFERGYARIEKGNYWAVIDENLNIIIPFNREYQRIENFKYGLAIAKKGTKRGVVNTHGDVVAHFKYYEIEDFKKGIARVRLKPRLYGYINTEGEEIIPPIYEYIGLFEKNVAVFWEGKKRGLIDTSSTIVAEAIYDEISGFFIDNNLIVRIEKKFGIISNTGQIVLPVQFDDLKMLIKTYTTLRESGLDFHNFSMN